MSRIIYRDPHVTIFQSVLFCTNSTVVATDDLLLVVDPAWLPDEVAAIRRFTDEIRGNRPLFLLFTHSDYDHILGYRAFDAEKVFISEAFANNPAKEDIIEQILDFDASYYIQRNYPIEYPVGDFLLYRDGVQFRYGQTKMTFYLSPGHTADSMMVVVWQLGLCIAGDYLSNVEFPIIYNSSVAYEQTLEKLNTIHDKNWFTRLVPGHGDPCLNISEWLRRRTESLAYIYACRESISTGIPFDEEALFRKYKFPRVQAKFHRNNLELMQREYEQGLWKWQPELPDTLLKNEEIFDED